MENNNASDEAPVASFGYDILDAEAAKISSLIRAVQMKCLEAPPAEAAKELYYWAESYCSKGLKAEAEFLYLYAINLWVKDLDLSYPVRFDGLQAHALWLCELSNKRRLQAIEGRGQGLATTSDTIPNSNAA